MSIIDQLNFDLKNAMKSRDKFRTATIRNLKSAIKYAEIDTEDRQLDDDGVLAVISKQAKQRRDSITEFKKAGRTDLVEKEEAELTLLETYLPEQMPEEEIRQKAQAVIDELGVTNMKGMGQVMKNLMPRLQGQADGKVVNQIVRQLLAG